MSARPDAPPPGAWRCRTCRGYWTRATAAVRRGLLECPLCLRAGLVGQLEEAWPYLWRVHARLPERYHQRCRVITRGKRNSALVQFEDGACYITSRNYLRKP